MSGGAPPAVAVEPGAAFHLVGIGGAGMSALAQALLDRGVRVTGSDRLRDAGDAPPIFETLRAAGARLFPQDGSGVTVGLRAVVASTAVEPGNADLAAASRQGVPVVHRAELLAELVRPSRVIAVAGTAGKTTVTAMAGFLLEQLGFDPAVINGGIAVAWDRPDRVGSVRAGAGGWSVVEVDESDRSLLHFHPAWAVVTNISKDHFERDEVESLFRRFVGQASEGVLASPEAAAALGGAATAPLIAAAPPEDARGGAEGMSFRWRGHEVCLAMPGRHNAENAALALDLCAALGANPAAAVVALARFRGVRRRLEFVGALRGAAVMDDYAHNPAKIAASWSAVAASGVRVLGVWRPHGFGPLSLLFDDLVETFAGALESRHSLFLLPVYYAGGTARGERTSDDLAAAIQARGGAAVAVRGYDELESAIRREAGPGRTILVMGARDPGLTAFCRRLVGPSGG